MAGFAHKVGTEAVEEGSGAAVHAFPVDLSLSVLGAGGLANTHLLDKAVLAHQVFLSFICIVLCSLHAVDETTEVRLLASVALVESAAVKSVLERLSIEVVTNSVDTVVLRAIFSTLFFIPSKEPSTLAIGSQSKTSIGALQLGQLMKPKLILRVG